ncbi:MAG: flagellar hook-associated protein FlgL [Sterolibacteriaceae bacterium]|nr:flagellar hook-associated protein FlgL [Candidatus Methylophosphatis haderslevensis]
MRVSTSMVFDQGTANLNRQTAAYLKTQNQLATGRRIVNPSDDPVAAARALEVTQRRDMNAQYLDNQKAARDALRTTEISLASLGDLLQDVRDNAMKAGNASLDDTQRRMIATDLRQQFGRLMSIANAKDANGEFLFAGFGLAAGETQPYEGSVEAGVTTNGDQGQRKLQVSASRQLAISNSGFEVFENVDRVGGGKQSVFDTVRNLVAALETPGAATIGAALPGALGNIDQALDNSLRVRADVGARSAEVDALDNAGSALDVQYQSTLSVLQDLDYNTAITNSAKLQTALTAAQKTFMQASQLSLFNYL